MATASTVACITLFKILAITSTGSTSLARPLRENDYFIPSVLERRNLLLQAIPNLSVER